MLEPSFVNTPLFSKSHAPLAHIIAITSPIPNAIIIVIFAPSGKLYGDDPSENANNNSITNTTTADIAKNGIIFDIKSDG